MNTTSIIQEPTENQRHLFNHDGPYIHPITGITHIPVGDAWEPDLVLNSNEQGTRMTTGSCGAAEFMDPDQRNVFDYQMNRIAKGLSQASGLNIRWHRRSDAINCYGDHGWFMIEKEQPI